MGEQNINVAKLQYVSFISFILSVSRNVASGYLSYYFDNLESLAKKTLRARADILALARKLSTCPPPPHSSPYFFHCPPLVPASVLSRGASLAAMSLSG